MEILTRLGAHINPEEGTIDGVTSVARRLSDLRGSFADQASYEARLAADDSVVYSVATAEPAHGAGQLHYGIGTIQPGCIGAEYYLTKGHLHDWRDAAEVYIGLRGTGHMLLEDEATGNSRLVSLARNDVVYVPGRTAHRTINTGDVPLVYLGVYPASAGHDYDRIRARNFNKVVVAKNGRPVLMDRAAFTTSDLEVL